MAYSSKGFWDAFLEKNGCEFLREGGDHTVYVDRKDKKVRLLTQAT